MGKRRKRDSTPKLPCTICGVVTKRVTVATLFGEEPMCWDCADRQRRQSKGKIQDMKTGIFVPVYNGRKRK